MTDRHITDPSMRLALGLPPLIEQADDAPHAWVIATCANGANLKRCTKCNNFNRCVKSGCLHAKARKAGR